MDKVFKKPIFWLYGLFLAWILLVLLLRNFASPLSMTLTFLGLIFVPGFLISRIYQVSYQDDLFGNLISCFVRGFAYNIFLALLALVLHLTLNQLIWLNLLIILIFFITGLVLDLRREHQILPRLKINYRYLLLYLALFFYLAVILMTVIQVGGNFNGDPLYHLSTMRKAVAGEPLSIDNLAYLKEQYHPAYIFSCWHIFLAETAKLANVNIFTLWQQIPIALTVLIFLVWYWLFLKLYANKLLASLGLFLAAAYIYWQNGYLFTRLAVPDTLSTYLLLPLCFALAIKYIFDQKTTWKHLAVLTFSVGLMTVIHQTQWLYYLLGIGLLLVIYAVSKYRDPDYKLTLEKILLALLSNLIIAIPIFIIIQIKGGTLTEHLGIFQTLEPVLRNDRFVKWDVYLKLAYIFLPLVLLFTRKNKVLLFILSLFLVGPIIHNIPGLKEWAIDNLSHVFIKRMYSNLGWAPAVLALIFGFLLLLIDRILFQAKREVRYLVDILLVLIFIGAIFLQVQFETVAIFYDHLLGQKTLDWLSGNYLWLIPLTVLISLAVFFRQKYQPKAGDFFRLDEPKEVLGATLILLTVVLMVSTLGLGHLKANFFKQTKTPQFFQKAPDPTHQVINFTKFGGAETLDFIQENISPKSVFDSSDANYVLATLVDVKMASYTFESDPTKKYAKIYDSTIPLEERLALIKDGRIEYILYLYQTGTKPTSFDHYPQYFRQIYSSQTVAIYQVN